MFRCIKPTYIFYFPFLLLLLAGLPGCAFNGLCPDCAPLERAVADGDYGRVVELLPKEPDVNKPLREGQTLLHYAATWPNRDIAQLLLDRGADPNTINDKGETPLNVAIRYGSESTALLFIERGADVEATVPNGPSVLTKAAARRNLQLVKAIIDKGADPARADGQRETPLFAAAQMGGEDVFIYLLDEVHRRSPEAARDPSALIAAANRGSLIITQALLERGVDPDARASTGVAAIVIAAYNGHEKLVDLLIDYGADPSIGDDVYGNALHAALLNRHFAIADYLIARNVKPAKITDTVFSTYASAMAHEMAGKRIRARDPQHARALLQASIELYTLTMKKGEALQSETSANIWKNRFTEMLTYAGAGLIGMYGSSPYIAGADPILMDVHMTAQDGKSKLKNMHKVVGDIMQDSQRRTEQCQSLLVLL